MVKPLQLVKVSKGSGMIHPNMATMLAFITTDASIESNTLHQLLKSSTDHTFNMITVDGDTSTNDMVLVTANQQVEHQILNQDHPNGKHLLMPSLLSVHF